MQRVLKRLRAVRRPEDLFALVWAALRVVWRRTQATRTTARLGDRFAAWRVALAVRHLHGPRRVALAEDDLVVVCLARDGETHIRSFVEHYLKLGAAWVVVLDNGSHDRTVALASSYPRVTVLGAQLPYRRFQRHMKNYLIRRFGRGRWSLCVDVDELFEYPGSGQVGLAAFLRYLRRGNYNAVVAQMLDMFAPGPLLAPHAPAGGPLRQAYPLADLSDVVWYPYAPIFGSACVVSNPAIQVSFGGVRKALFNSDVLLTKHPLLFLEGAMQPGTHVADPLKRAEPVAVTIAGAEHQLHPYQHGVSGARVADLSCVLYHYKLTTAFPAQVARAVAEENYYGRSGEYKRYKAAIERNPGLSPDGLRAWRPRDADELVERGFLVVSNAYVAWLAQHGGPRLLEALPARQESGLVRKSTL